MNDLLVKEFKGEAVYNFVINNVDYMRGVFSGCSSLKE